MPPLSSPPLFSTSANCVSLLPRWLLHLTDVDVSLCFSVGCNWANSGQCVEASWAILTLRQLCQEFWGIIYLFYHAPRDSKLSPEISQLPPSNSTQSLLSSPCCHIPHAYVSVWENSSFRFPSSHFKLYIFGQDLSTWQNHSNDSFPSRHFLNF